MFNYKMKKSISPAAKKKLINKIVKNNASSYSSLSKGEKKKFKVDFKKALNDLSDKELLWTSENKTIQRNIMVKLNGKVIIKRSSDKPVSKPKSKRSSRRRSSRRSSRRRSKRSSRTRRRSSRTRRRSSRTRRRSSRTRRSTRRRLQRGGENCKLDQSGG